MNSTPFLRERAARWQRGQAMGVPAVPFTFPTISAFNRMKFYGTDMGTYKAVDAMFDYYVKGVTQQGAKPIDFKASAADNKAIWAWMGKKYPAAAIQNFFRMLNDLPEQWWRLAQRTPGEVISAAVVSVGAKTVGGTKAVIRKTVDTAVDVAAEAPKAFFGAFPTWALVAGGIISVAFVAGIGYVIVRRA